MAMWYGMVWIYCHLFNQYPNDRLVHDFWPSVCINNAAMNSTLRYVSLHMCVLSLLSLFSEPELGPRVGRALLKPFPFC